MSSRLPSQKKQLQKPKQSLAESLQYEFGNQISQQQQQQQQQSQLLTPQRSFQEKVSQFPQTSNSSAIHGIAGNREEAGGGGQFSTWISKGNNNASGTSSIMSNIPNNNNSQTSTNNITINISNPPNDYYYNQQQQCQIEHLNLSTFKIDPCPYQEKHETRRCAYYHTAKDRRRAGVSLGKSQQSIENCEKGERCTVEQCLKIHNQVEVHYSPEQYKRTFCLHYPDNLSKCEYGSFCSFAHSEGDIKIELLHLLPHDDEFYLFKYKTVFCPFRGSDQNHQRDRCEYAHNQQDYRRPPDVYSYEPNTCPHWRSKEKFPNYEDGCANGYECNKCHGWKELDYHPRLFRTRSCQSQSQSNVCKKPYDCPHYHNAAEMRQIPASVTSRVFQFVPRNQTVSLLSIKQSQQQLQQQQSQTLKTSSFPSSFTTISQSSSQSFLSSQNSFNSQGLLQGSFSSSSSQFSGKSPTLGSAGNNNLSSQLSQQQPIAPSSSSSTSSTSIFKPKQQQNLLLFGTQQQQQSLHFSAIQNQQGSLGNEQSANAPNNSNINNRSSNNNNLSLPSSKTFSVFTNSYSSGSINPFCHTSTLLSSSCTSGGVSQILSPLQEHLSSHNSTDSLKTISESNQTSNLSTSTINNPAGIIGSAASSQLWIVDRNIPKEINIGKDKEVENQNRGSIREGAREEDGEDEEGGAANNNEADDNASASNFGESIIILKREPNQQYNDFNQSSKDLNNQGVEFPVQQLNNLKILQNQSSSCSEEDEDQKAAKQMVDKLYEDD